MLKPRNINIAVKINLESKVQFLNVYTDTLGVRANPLEDLTQAANQEHVTVKDAMPDDKLTLQYLLNWDYVVDPIPNRVLQLLAKSVNHSKDYTIVDYTKVTGRLH